MTVYLFLGPTMSSAEALGLLPDAVCLPPVSQGDVYRAAIQRPRAIGIVDGYFERVPAVWHKEILWATSQGIHVYGSASMGALRAAELAPFGMKGIGAIFEAYRDGALEDDDEVAVAHATAEFGYRVLSDAMVNIRATLMKAEAEGVLSAALRAALVRIAKDLFYPKRTYPEVIRRAVSQGWPRHELDGFRHWLPHGKVDQKQADARAMLEKMREQLAANAAPKCVHFSLEHTDYWERAMRQAGEMPLDGDVTADALVLNELQLDSATQARAGQGALFRHLALAAARRQEIPIHAEVLLDAADQFCRARGLDDSDDVEHWLKDHHLCRDQLTRLLEQEVLLQRMQESARLETRSHLMDYLRLSGEYAGLLARARARQCARPDKLATCLTHP
jgi:hypothetical protein